MNLDRRIKRHVIGARHDCFAIAQPGHEDFTRQELAGLSPTLDIGESVKGGVAFSGRLTDLYLANLNLRTAGRVLMRLAVFKAAGFDQLEKHARSVPWCLYLPPGAVPEFNVTARHSRLYHTSAVAGRMVEWIAAAWSDLGIDPAASQDQTVFMRLEDDVLTISLDSSGENLYRRGMKTHAARAPLRETLAALVLQIAGYDPQRPLLDPMCGGGTFSLEAALMAKAVAPGSFREFAFMRWPAFRPARWQHIKSRATEAIRQLERPMIWASDIDPAACQRLSGCVDRNGLDDAIGVRQNDFFDLKPESFGRSKGLIVLNPPYGRRLAADTAPMDLYHRIAAKLTRDFKGWRAALLVPGQQMARRLDLPLKSHSLAHGGLQMRLLVGRLK